MDHSLLRITLKRDGLQLMIQGVFGFDNKNHQVIYQVQDETHQFRPEKFQLPEPPAGTEPYMHDIIRFLNPYLLEKYSNQFAQM